jgi:hypothetical protein
LRRPRGKKERAWWWNEVLLWAAYIESRDITSGPEWERQILPAAVVGQKHNIPAGNGTKNDLTSWKSVGCQRNKGFFLFIFPFPVFV